MIFRKIYIAIISLFIALSCVAPTESIEATATSVTLSLEQTRTQLGDKADGIYPLYWSEGDKISINGVESAAAVVDAENPSRATFTINGEVGEVRHIAYPANTESSSYVGTVGEKIKQEVMLNKELYFRSNYGYNTGTYIYIMKNEQGNVLVWKTSKSLDINEEEKFIITGTIKEYNTYDGIKQTILTRCKIS